MKRRFEFNNYPKELVKRITKEYRNPYGVVVTSERFMNVENDRKTYFILVSVILLLVLMFSIKTVADPLHAAVLRKTETQDAPQPIVPVQLRRRTELFVQVHGEPCSHQGTHVGLE